MTRRNCASRSFEDLARRNRETRALLAEVGEKDQRVLCIDDVTSKELPWHEVRQGREFLVLFFFQKATDVILFIFGVGHVL